MTYKAIPGPKVISITNGNHSEATDAFANIINAEAVDGWKYHSMETITVQEKAGCSLQPQIVNTNIYMLIFCHE
jgi:sorbitol-specific phosphotransferase system component IIBC